MRIRTHLIILVVAAVLPILVFSAAMTTVFWREQRRTFEQRFLERVRAMTVALDTELERYIAVLEVLGKSPSLSAGRLKQFYQEAVRVRDEQLFFTNIILTAPDGQELINLDHPLGAGLGKTPLPPAMLENAATSDRPVISGILKNVYDGKEFTAIIVPVKHGHTVSHLLVAVIKQSAWLSFLSRYPVPADATMTLLDQNGTIIARTLNNERWAGHHPAPALYNKSREVPEAAYRSIGLEGQRFYSAHSRSAVSGWTVATGVPQQGVELILRGSTLAMGGGALAALFLAIWLAFIFGRRISLPVSALERLARSLATDEGAESEPSNNIVEVREVGQAIETAREQLKARESALKDSEQRFRLVTQLMPGVVWTAGPDGTITFANDRWYAYTGLSPEDDAHDWLRPVLHPDDYERCRARWLKSLRECIEYEIEARNRRWDGEYRWWLTRAIPVKDIEGRVSAWYGFSMDIHDMKEAREALRESEEKLRHQARELENQLIASGRLVSVGEVTASMAHEFNNPLGIVMGFTQDLLSETDPESPQYQPLKIIDEETRRCQKIVQDLLEFARPGKAEFAPTDVKQTIEKTLNLVSHRVYKQKIQTTTRFDEQLPPIYADSRQLEQVLLNLYLNAIDSMPQGGTLAVEAMFESSNGAGLKAKIAVTDTGFGIDEQDLGKIFQPFFTARKRRGLGLGLPICQRIIRNHGGRIEVASRVEKGTTFSVYLPVNKKTAEADNH
jgi:PAS domain S-box-containing protein